MGSFCRRFGSDRPTRRPRSLESPRTPRRSQIIEIIRPEIGVFGAQVETRPRLRRPARGARGRDTRPDREPAGLLRRDRLPRRQPHALDPDAAGSDDSLRLHAHPAGQVRPGLPASAAVLRSHPADDPDADARSFPERPCDRGPRARDGADPLDGRRSCQTCDRRSRRFRLATRIAINRTVAGLHYPIDSACGAVLGIALGEYLAKLGGLDGARTDSWVFDGDKYMR